MISPEALARFKITPADLLGQGGESQVFALPASEGQPRQVLRVYKAGVSEKYIECRENFYRNLAARQPNFELPHILASGKIEGRHYVIEQRFRGQDLGLALMTLDGAPRRKALTSYLELSAKIGALSLAGEAFGELLAPEKPLRRSGWRAYLWARLQQALEESRADVLEDYPHLDAALERLAAEFGYFDAVREPCLVHGDFFPANVFVDDDQNLYAVSDFGYTTVAGDPFMDRAAAVAFLEVGDWYRPQDTAYLTREYIRLFGAQNLPALVLYRMYYSLYFSVCKRSDNRTYRWCIQNLWDYFTA